MLFRCRNSNEFPVSLCDAEGDSLLAACFGVDIREGLVDCDAVFLTEILEGLQVRQLPRCDLHANSPLIKHEDKPDINFVFLCIREPFLSSMWSGSCWKRVMIFV